MTFKELKLKIKEEQKELARIIRRGKNFRKAGSQPVTVEDENTYFSKSAFNDTIYFNEWKLTSIRNKYRHRHIVYCNMFNRTPYDKIEQPRDYNSPSSHKLEEIKKEWESLLDE